METILKLDNLKMNYGSKEVLKGINLEVHRGEIVGYIGANGAGKSTTIKIILGLLTPTSGSIELFGEKISAGDVTYKKRIGYVPESADLYDNLTAKEYLTFMGTMYGLEEKVASKKALKLMTLFGIGNVFEERIASYSKGMRQKVLIISSLLHDPELIFFDEPINGMDANSVMIFKEIMSELAQRGKTIFYSSHIMEVVERISSRIVLLNNGEVSADGTFEQLQKSSKEGSLEEIFNSLTGFTRHEEIASEFVQVLEEA